MSRFSIIVPVYNVEKYLDECVKSVLAQTFSDFELILVDDGSKDASGALCDTLALTDTRIRVVHQENQGLSGARNTGIQAATGDYLMFLDSDDWWAGDGCLQRVADRLAETQADVLSFNYQKSFDGVLSAPYFQNAAPAETQTLEHLLDRNLWVTGACNKAISRKLVLNHDLFFRRGITSEDIDWTLRLALSAKNFDFADICVFVYRQRSGSITHSVTLKSAQCLCDNITYCMQLLEQADAEKAAVLRSFVAYQYATLLFNYASLKKADRTKALTDAVRAMRPWLAYSQNPKVRLLFQCNRFFGFGLTIKLLRLKQGMGK